MKTDRPLGIIKAGRRHAARRSRFYQVPLREAQILPSS